MDGLKVLDGNFNNKHRMMNWDTGCAHTKLGQWKQDQEKMALYVVIVVNSANGSWTLTNIANSYTEGKTLLKFDSWIYVS